MNWILYHLACVSSVMARAMFNQPVLVKVLAVAVRTGKCVTIWHWTVREREIT